MQESGVPIIQVGRKACRWEEKRLREKPPHTILRGMKNKNWLTDYQQPSYLWRVCLGSTDLALCWGVYLWVFCTIIVNKLCPVCVCMCVCVMEQWLSVVYHWVWYVYAACCVSLSTVCVCSVYCITEYHRCTRYYVAEQQNYIRITVNQHITWMWPGYESAIPDVSLTDAMERIVPCQCQLYIRSGIVDVLYRPRLRGYNRVKCCWEWDPVGSRSCLLFRIRRCSTVSRHDYSQLYIGSRWQMAYILLATDQCVCGLVGVCFMKNQ